MTTGMLPLGQLGQDLPGLLDAAIMYASKSGEHMAVMEKSGVERHTFERGKGDTFKGVHMAKIQAMRGSDRTRFTQASRHAYETYEFHLGITSCLVILNDNLQIFAHPKSLKQFGGQQADAIARDVDRVLLTEFSTATVTVDRSGQALLLANILDMMAKLEAAEDDRGGMPKVIAPIHPLYDLLLERLGSGPSTGTALVRPLTEDAAMQLTKALHYDIGGTVVTKGKNAPRFNNDGYTGIFHPASIKFATASVLTTEEQRDPSQGIGAKARWVRKYWGHVIPSFARRNWFASVKSRMTYGGK